MDKKFVFIFPGQGAQYVGMGKDFCENFEEAKAIFNQADEILGWSLSKLIFEDPEKVLTLTKNSQLAIFVVSCAILEVFKSKFPNVVPFACAGLSLGEYSALYASGKISFEEGLKIVEARGLFMHEASENNPGSLSAVLGLDVDLVQEVLDKAEQPVWIANLNCPGQVVISGSLKGLEVVTEALKQKGAKRVIPLSVSGAFHSGLMKEAQDKLTPFIEKSTINTSETKLVMNVPGSFVEDVEGIKKHLISQIVEPTLWEKSIRLLEQDKVDFYIEIGPGKSLSGMNKKIKVNAETLTLEKIEDLENIKEKLMTTSIV